MYSEDLLSEYISNTTKEERHRLLQHDFDLLWKDLWVSTRRRLYRAEMKRAKEHWDQSIEKIRALILSCPTVGRDIWEFPKGRMFVEETAQACALREFEEETNISSSLVSLVHDAGTFEDNYQGTDHKMYRSIYYLGYIPNGMNVKFEYKDCPHQVRNPYISDEVMDIQWMDIEKATEMITPSRRKVLNQVVDFLNSSYQD
jgi:8-oxo-dGTP pyrophosphatase MutT (NUDIX family)